MDPLRKNTIILVVTYILGKGVDPTFIQHLLGGGFILF